MNRPLDSERAVSEVLGTAVLIGVVVTAFTIAGLVVFSQPKPQKIPALNAIISTNAQTIDIHHNGGDSFLFDDLQILLDSQDFTNAFKEDGAASWSTWSVGQSLTYDIPTGYPVPSLIQIVFKGGGFSQLIASSGEGEGSMGTLPVPAPSVTGITPNSGPVGAVIPITDLAGSNFFNGASVKLSRAGYADIPASSVVVVSQSKITCQFNLAGSTPGAYDVVVTNPGGPSGTLANGFTVVVAVPPTADFSGTPVMGPVPLMVSFTDLSTNFPESWVWTFGDGNTSFAQNPTNTYQTSGNYSVGLTATNSAGSNNTIKNGYILAYYPAVADFNGTPTSGPDPLTVSFKDLSTGSPSSWFWHFGDITPLNTSTLQNPGHTYHGTGTYSVNLTVANAFSSSYLLRSDYITVTVPPPVADFEAFPTTGIAPLTVYFNDTSTGSPTSWYFVFGDFGAGNTSTSPDPIHTYTNPGSYTVNETVSNAGGSNTTIKTNLINVYNAVVADFFATPTTVLTSQLVQFNDTSTGSPTSWSWRFGDIGAGNTSTIQNPTHAYSSAGTYTVRLTASNPGSSNTKTRTNYITVNWGAPTVTAITPNSGTTGTTVSITNLAGTGFQSGATVKLTKSGSSDITATSVNVVSSSKITCQLNLAGATAGSWDVVVTNADLQSGSLLAGFTVLNPAPTVTGITPASAPTGTTVSITNLAGTGFLSGATVKLNRSGSSDITATSVNVVTSTQITCQFNLAGATVGTWNVVVTNTDGQSGLLVNGFTVLNPAPTVTAITPSSGNRGWPVSITNLQGTGFLSGATVKLTKSGSSDITGTSVVVLPTQITCTFDLVGATAGAWNVVVTNTDLQSGTLADGFTVNSPAPTLTVRNPTSGARGWPVSVTLTGTGFQPGATVNMTRSGSTPIVASGVTVSSSTSITCTFDLLGATQATNWAIRVTNTDGKASGTLAFSVTSPAPTIPASPLFSPNAGALGTTGLSITAPGGNLQPGLAVVLTRSSTTITAYNVNVVSPSSVTFTIDIPAGATTGLYTARYTNTDAKTVTRANRFNVTAT